MPGPVGGGRSGGGGGLGGGVSGGSRPSAGGSFSGGHRPFNGGFRHTPEDGRPFGGHRRSDTNKTAGGCLIPVIMGVFMLYILFSGGILDDLLYAIRNLNGTVVQTEPYSVELTAEVDWLWEEDLSVTPNAYVREKLDASLCNPVELWFQDEANLFAYESDAYKVVNALQYFYEQTGVQPFLLTLDNIDGDHYPDWDTVETFLYDFYVGMFGADEGHYVFLYFSYADGFYTLYYIPGLDAMSVMDDNASEILMDYVDLYYQYVVSYSDLFNQAFIASADAIMEDPAQTDTVMSTTAPPASTEPAESDPANTDESVTAQTGEPVSEEYTSSVPSAAITQLPDENQSHTPGADIGTQTTDGDVLLSDNISVKRLVFFAFGAIIVATVIVLAAVHNKKKMEELERM